MTVGIGAAIPRFLKQPFDPAMQALVVASHDAIAETELRCEISDLNRCGKRASANLFRLRNKNRGAMDLAMGPNGEQEDLSTSSRHWITTSHEKTACRPPATMKTRIWLHQCTWLLISWRMLGAFAVPAQLPAPDLRSAHSHTFRMDQMAHSIANSPKSLERRDLHNEQAAHHVAIVMGWYCIWSTLNVIYPMTEEAIQAFELFFSTALSLAGAVWSTQAARTTRSATMGGITLNLISNAPIPWPWIRDFLISAVRLASFNQWCCLILESSSHLPNLVEHSSALPMSITHEAIGASSSSWSNSRWRSDLSK